MRVRGRGGFDTANSTSVEAYSTGSSHWRVAKLSRQSLLVGNGE